MRYSHFQHWFYEKRRVWEQAAISPESNPQWQNGNILDMVHNSHFDQTKLQFELTRKNFERSQNLNANGGVGEFKPNISEDLDRVINTNKVGIPAQEPHFKEMVHKIAMKNVSASARMSGINQEVGVSLEVGRDDLSKNLKDLHLEKNGAVQEYTSKNIMPSGAVQKADIDRLKNENGAKLLTVTQSLNQIWKGLMPNQATGQTRTPAHNPTVWKGVADPAPSHYSQISLENAVAWQKKLENNPALGNGFNADLRLLLGLVIEHHILSEQTKTLNSAFDVTQRQKNIADIQSQIILLEAQAKSTKNLLESYDSVYPRSIGRSEALEMTKADLQRTQRHIIALKDTVTILAGKDPTQQVLTQLGYENGQPPKDENILMMRSLDVMKNTYKYSYEMLTQNNAINANQEALNALLEICVMDGVSPSGVLDFFTKLTTYSTMSGSTQSATDVLAWIAGTAKGAPTPLSEETRNMLERVSPVWGNIERAVTKRALFNGTYGVEVDRSLSISAQAGFERTTGIMLSPVHTKWKELSASPQNSDGSQNHYGQYLQLDQWFAGDGTVKNPQILEQYLRENVLPNDGPYAQWTFMGFDDDPDAKFLGLARMLHGALLAKEKANASMGNLMDNKKKVIENMSADKVFEVLSSETQDFFDAISSGNIKDAVPGALILLGLWKLWKSKAGKNGLIFAGAALALDTLQEKYTGESQLGKGWEYLMGEGEEKSRNLANMIVKRNEDTLAEWSKNGDVYTVDTGLMMKAGNVMGGYDAAQVFNWYGQVKTLQAQGNASSQTSAEILKNEECMKKVPKNASGKSMLDEIRGLMPEKGKDSVEAEKAAIDFLDFFFANVAEDKIGKKIDGSKSLFGLAINGFNWAKEHSLDGDPTQNPNAQPIAGRKMIQIYDELVPDEVKTKSMLQQSAAWADLSALYNGTENEVLTFMEKNGIKNPIEYMKDFGSWMSKTGYTVMSFVNNEIVLRDHFNNVWKLTVDGGKYIWENTLGHKVVKESAKAAFEWMKEQAKLAGGIIQNANESWNAFFASPVAFQKSNEKFDDTKIVDSIKNLGLEDQIRKTYGIDSSEDFQYFITEIIKTGTPVWGEIEAIRDNRIKNPANKNANPPMVTDVTNGDIIMYFFNGISGVGSMAQSLVNTAEVGTGFVTNNALPVAGAAAGGMLAAGPGLVAVPVGVAAGAAFGGLTSLNSATDGAKAFFQTYSTEKLFQGNVQQYLDGNKSFRDAIKNASEESIKTGTDMHFTAETLAREGNREVARFLENKPLASADNYNALFKARVAAIEFLTQKPYEYSSTTSEHAKTFAREAMQRKFADPAERSKMIHILKNYYYDPKNPPDDPVFAARSPDEQKAIEELNQVKTILSRVEALIPKIEAFQEIINNPSSTNFDKLQAWLSLKWEYNGLSTILSGAGLMVGGKIIASAVLSHPYLSVLSLALTGLGVLATDALLSSDSSINAILDSYQLQNVSPVISNNVVDPLWSQIQQALAIPSVSGVGGGSVVAYPGNITQSVKTLKDNVITAQNSLKTAQEKTRPSPASGNKFNDFIFLETKKSLQEYNKSIQR